MTGEAGAPIGVDERIVADRLRRVGKGSVRVEKTGRTERHDVVAGQRRDPKVRVEVLAIADPEIDRVTDEVDRIFLDPQIDADLVVRGDQVANALRQPPMRQGGKHADDQLRAHVVVKHASGHCRDSVEAARGPVIDDPAGIGQADAVVVAFKQLFGEIGFDLADLLAHRRRGHSELASGLDIGAGAARGFKCLQGVQGRQNFFHHIDH